MIKKKLALVALCVITVVPTAFWVHRQLSIDDCLDAGGSWDYEIGDCDND